MNEQHTTLAACPFFGKETSGRLACELATIRFPDKQCKQELKIYCCDMHRYKECTLYRILDSYYERKYSEVKS